MSGVVVLHSGGQDSSTVLAWAAQKWGPEEVHPVSFFYDQKHQIELDCAVKVTSQLGISGGFVMRLDILRDLGAAALTNPDIEVNSDATGTGNIHAETHGLPSTFVPGRNMLFLTLAAAYGAQHGVYDLVTGVCETDAAGYPDCRKSFVIAAENALTEALDEEVTVHAPLVELSKAQTFDLADTLGVLDMILKDTHTCYRGDRTHMFEWGYGCGECPACGERSLGWEQYKEMKGLPV